MPHPMLHMVIPLSISGALRRIGQASCLALMLVLAMAGPALAQSAPTAAHATASADQAAPVLVQHRKVALLRGSFMGVPPAERARKAEQAVEELLAKGGPGQVTVADAPQGKVLLVDGAFAFFLMPEDADHARGQTLEAATQDAVQALTHAIGETREARDKGRLLRAALYSALATLIFALVVGVALRIRRALAVRTTMLLEKAAGTQAGALAVLHPARLRLAANWLVGVVTWLVVAVLAYEWLAFVLTRFAYTRTWGEQLGTFLFGVLQRIGGSVLDALPDLMVALVILLLARGVTALARPMFDRAEHGQSNLPWLDRDLAVPTRRIFNTAVWLFAIAMVYPYLPGAQSDAFKGISVLVGLMLTLGGSSLVGQGASGLILMYSRTLRVGEFVRVNDQEGTVTELGTFTTKIRTGLGEEISMPNSLIMGSVTKNYSRTVRGQGYILDAIMTIGYDTPWRQVEAMMVEAAQRTDGVLQSPAPQVFKTGLSDFYVEYRLVCQAIPSQPRPRAEVMQLLHSNLLDVFNEHGVQIMSPHYFADPSQAKVVPRDQWWTAPAEKRGESRKS
ncbi:MAG TPA: mechanosensitive ion channel domain-containing protein [Variovorax sp.]|nr:mechanosensitive ion channel domain-containing protein [Variovorax sp.]